VDRSTVAGILVGLILIGGAILIGPSVGVFLNLPALLIVGGGILAATLIRFPAPVVFGSLRVIRQAFMDKIASPVDLMRDLVRLSTVVHRGSLLDMEKQPISDGFLRRAVELCVDGVDPGTIETVLRSEVAYLIERHDRGQRILRGMGSSAPAFGMIGTLIGLVQMLTRLNDPAKLGGAMAVAMLTTFYGALLAYLIFLPLADKLAERSRQETVNREIVIQGTLAILAGYHPRMVERRLLGLLEPGQRPKAWIRPFRSRVA
jgi:chemotaxis protein MotA